jgi:hypothetical protein
MVRSFDMLRTHHERHGSNDLPYISYRVNFLLFYQKPPAYREKIFSSGNSLAARLESWGGKCYHFSEGRY